MNRHVAATITDMAGQAREGLVVFFHAPEGHDDVTAKADASGFIFPELETGIEYRVSVENAVQVDGVVMPPGTIILVRVPEGVGAATAQDVLIGTIDASRTALLDRIAALEDRIQALESTPIEQGATEAGNALASLREQV